MEKVILHTLMSSCFTDIKEGNFKREDFGRVADALLQIGVTLDSFSLFEVMPICQDILEIVKSGYHNISDHKSQNYEEFVNLFLSESGKINKSTISFMGLILKDIRRNLFY